MEPKFKTSFIPKQSLGTQKEQKPAKRQGGPRGIAMVVGLVILILTAGAAGIVFFYKDFLSGSIDEKIASLERARDAFQPRLIAEFEELDQRIRSAEVLLAEHLAPSMLFSLLESVTLKSVQYTDLSYEFLNQNVVEIVLTGTALNFDSVALQSDVLGNNRFIRQPVISDLAVSGEDRVAFKVTAQVDPRFLLYEATLDEEDVRQQLEAVGRTLK